MSRFQKWIFNLISKMEKKKEEANEIKKDLSQPSPNNNSKGSKTKTILKKLIPLFIVIAILALIIGLAVGLTNKPTKHDFGTLNSSSVTWTNGSPDKGLTIKDTNNNSISINWSNPVVKVQPGPGVETLRYYINGNSNLPFLFNVQIEPWIENSIIPVKVNGYTFKLDAKNLSADYTQLSTPAEAFALLLYNNSTKLDFIPTPFNWAALVSSLFPILFIILIMWLSYRMMKKNGLGGAEGIFGIGKMNSTPVKSNVRFTDVAGISEVKEELLEIVDFIKRPTKYAEMGARCPKGLLLYGPPGTGKTLIAKAVAGEANCSFYQTSGSSFDDMLVGVGAKRVKDIFATARKNAPAIIFIDEVDSVAAKRGSNKLAGDGGGFADQTINQLLAEMDGFDTKTGVIVIAATNRLDVIDEAFLRPGRFDRQIQVSLPDIKEREEILKIHSRNKNISKSVDLLEIARRTPGFSGAQLENVLNEATLLAVRENKIAVTTNNIDEAIDRTIGGPKRTMRVMTDSEKRQISYHEAGHALVGLYADSPEVVQKITIIPRGNAAGYTLQTPKEQEKQIQTKQDLLDMIRMTLGGRAAEEIIFGSNKISTGAANDLYKVTKIVRSMVTQLGMSELGLTQFVPSEGQQPMFNQYSDQTGKLIDSTIDKIIKIEYEKAKKIILEHKDELDLFVETLLTLETILKHQIDYIHNNKQLPKEVLEMKKEIQNQKDEAEENKEKEEN